MSCLSPNNLQDSVLPARLRSSLAAAASRAATLDASDVPPLGISASAEEGTDNELIPLPLLAPPPERRRGGCILRAAEAAAAEAATTAAWTDLLPADNAPLREVAAVPAHPILRKAQPGLWRRPAPKLSDPSALRNAAVRAERFAALSALCCVAALSAFLSGGTLHFPNDFAIQQDPVRAAPLFVMPGPDVRPGQDSTAAPQRPLSSEKIIKESVTENVRDASGAEAERQERRMKQRRHSVADAL